jgi:hypothetical protein
MKIRLLLGLAVPCGLAGVCFWLFLWWTTPRINYENLGKIERGMSQAEVIAILNSRPHYAPGKLRRPDASGVATALSMRIEAEGHAWVSDECVIYVTFDDDLKVTGTMWCSRGGESFFDKVRRWLRF